MPVQDDLEYLAASGTLTEFRARISVINKHRIVPDICKMSESIKKVQDPLQRKNINKEKRDSKKTAAVKKQTQGDVHTEKDQINGKVHGYPKNTNKKINYKMRY